MTVEIRRRPGDARLADAHAVRRAVFVEEQGVSEAEEMDGRDEGAIHVVAYALDGGAGPGHTAGGEERGRPVGTARLRVPEPDVAKPERVAVVSSRRGEGLGERLMTAIESEARAQGCERARLHAQTTVEAFYRELGYETTGDIFDEAGIPHVEMVKEL